MKVKNRVASWVFLTLFLSVAEVLSIYIHPASASTFQDKIETIASNNENEKNTEDEEACDTKDGTIICPP